MSKLSDYQIRALLEGMYATVERLRQAGKVSEAHRSAKRIREYEAELAERAAKPVKLTGFPEGFVENTAVAGTKTGQVDRKSEERMETTKKTALQVAGEHLDTAPEDLVELGKWIGRGQAFGMIGAKASAAQAQVLKRMKDGAEYKALGITWDQFCPQHIGMDRKTVERIIANFEEFGAAYFALSAVTRISPTTYRLIAGSVDESTVEIDGEKIKITRDNAGRIAEAVSALAKRVEQQDEALKEKGALAEKYKGERNAASKGADRIRAEFNEYKAAQSKMFAAAGEDEDYRTLLEAQSLFDLAMGKLAATYKRDLGDENQARYIGLTDYLYRALVQASFEARDKYGCAWNLATPVELDEAERVAAGPRNLVAEIGGKRG